MATDPASMRAALDEVGDTRPAIYAATRDNIDRVIDLAVKFICPRSLRRPRDAGVEDLILDSGGPEAMDIGPYLKRSWK